MSSRVNKPFVVMLSLALLIMAGGVTWLAATKLSGGDRHIKAGDELVIQADELLAKGDEAGYREAIKKASSRFARGVNKEPTNVAWITKWREALVRVYPEGQTEADKLYRRDYMMVLQSLADLHRDDPEYALALVEENWRRIRMSGSTSIEAYQQLIDTVDRHTASLGDSAMAERARSIGALAMVTRMSQVDVPEADRLAALEQLKKSYEVSRSDGDAPVDWRSGLGIAQWYAVEADYQRVRGATAKAQEADEQLRQALESMLADVTVALEAAPTDGTIDWAIQAAAMRFQQDIRERTRTIGIDNVSQWQATAAELQGSERAEVLCGLLETVRDHPEQAGADIGLGLNRSESVIAFAGCGEVLADAAWALWASRSDELMLTLTAGTILIERGRLEDGIRVLAIEEVDGDGKRTGVPTPAFRDRPVSLDGFMTVFMRRAAVYHQLGAVVSLWEGAKRRGDAAAVGVEQARANELLESLRALADRSSQMMVDHRAGEVAFLEGRYEDAVLILSGLRGSVNESQTQMMLAESLIRTNSPGNAKEVLTDMLARLRGDGRDDAAARFSLAQVSMQLNDWDEAVKQLQRAAQILPGSYEPMLRLGDVYRRRIVTLGPEALDDEREAMHQAAVKALDKAESLAQAVLDREASNESALSALERIEGVREGLARAMVVYGGGSPVAAALAEARELSDLERHGEAVEVLLAGYESTSDSALLIQAVRSSQAAGDGEGALELAKRGEVDFPENPWFGTVVKQLEAGGSGIEQAVARIESAGLSEREEHIALGRAYLLYRDVDEAQAQVDALVALDKGTPEGVRGDTIELAFNIALAREDLEKAQEWATVAAQENADQAGGRVYAGRMELARGRYREASQAFEAALADLEFNPDAWWWLGKARQGLGQVGGAIEAFAEAHQGRPNDKAIGLDYTYALANAGRGGEALPVARRLRDFDASDKRIREHWLSLEASHGDRALAKTRRAALFAASPGDLDNAQQHIGLLIEDSEWDAAGAAIDTLAQTDGVPKLAVVGARAEWYARQGALADGIREYEVFLNSIDEAELTAPPIMEFARFLRRNAGRRIGETNLDLRQAAREILTDAIKYQTEAKEADRALADLLIEMAVFAQSAGAEEEVVHGLLRDAEESVESVLTGSRATDADRLLLARVHLMLGEGAEASAALASLTSMRDEDESVLLLRSQVAAIEGKMAQARELADRAVELYPARATVFMHRARLNASEPALSADVFADLEQVTSLDPSNLHAWAQRFAMHVQRGEESIAFALLREAVDKNPNELQLRQEYVLQLEAAGRIDSAVSEAMRGVEVLRRDPRWLAIAAALCERHERWTEAASLFGLMWEPLARGLDEKAQRAAAASGAEAERLRDELEVSKGFALRETAAYLSAVMKASDRPDRALVLRLIQTMPNELKPEPANVKYMLLRGRALRVLGNDDGAIVSIRKALGPAIELAAEPASEGGGSGLLRYWVQQTDDILGKRETTLTIAEQGRSGAEVPNLLKVYEIMASGESAGARLVSLASLEPSVEGDPVALFELLDARSDTMIAMGDFEGASVPLMRAAELAPDDPGAQNNLAYILAVYLDRPEDAVPYAERAVALVPNWSSALDTLGTVYLNVDPPRNEEARDILVRATQSAKTPGERVAANLHLGQAHLALGNRFEADASRSRAAKALDEMPDSSSEKSGYAEQIEALKEAIANG